MRAALCAMAMTGACISTAQASDKSDIEATLRKAFAAANAGDTAGMNIAPGGVVIDEFAPFHWTGFGGWGPAYAAYNAQNAVTGARTTILGFRHINVSGTHAYAVLRVAYTYKEHGKPRKEAGTEVFVLEKGATGWQSNSFAWLSKGGVDEGADATAAADAVRAVMDGFNTGKIDFASLKWIGIIDEFPPYHWQGDGTVAGWGGDFQKSGQAGLTLTLAAPTHLSVNGDDAYVVFPAAIVGKQNGKPLHETGSFAFVVSKAGGTWHSISWAWAIN
jgi:hypothetical protein